MSLKSQSKVILNQTKEVSEKSKFSVMFDNSVNLFTLWYDEQSDDRLTEYELCLQKNLDNELIDKVYVICENVYPKNHFSFNGKIEYIFTEKRLTYNEIFDIINIKSSEFSINILSNTDIYFDNTLRYVDSTLKREFVYCLSRWNVQSNGESIFHNRKDSQDVWIFRGKVKQNIYGDFNLGIAGCDNRIAYELKKSGYKLLNPSLSIKAHHLHLTGVRNYKNGSVVKRVSQPYEMVPPCLLSSDDFKAVSKQVKSVLHIALNSDFQKSLGKAISSLGHYSIIDWRKTLGEDKNLKLLHQKILRTVYEYRPEFIFMQIQTPNIITTQLINDINELVPNTVILNWNGDIRLETPSWMIDLGELKNVHTAFTNMRDVEELQKLGLPNTHFVPIGFEETVFNNDRDGVIFRSTPKLVFTGNNYGEKFPLTPVRSEMISILKNIYHNSFWVQGSGWNQYSNRAMSKITSARLYKHSKIGLSVNNINAFRYSSDRLFNIMACNCFTLVHYCEGLDLDFQDKKHVVYWRTYKELVDLVHYYLHNNEERKQIAHAGYLEVWDKHRWINRINKFVKEVLQW